MDVLFHIYKSKFPQLPKNDLEASQFLVQNGVTAEQIKQDIEKTLKIAYFNPKDVPIDYTLIHKCPIENLKQRGVLPIQKSQDGIVFVINEMFTGNIKSYLEPLAREVFKAPISKIIYFALNYEVYDLITKLYAKEDVTNYQYEFPKAEEKQRFAQRIEGTSPKDIVEDILRKGIDIRASDIHFEPLESGVAVRYRVDGLLSVRDFFTYSDLEIQGITNRFKIISNLKIEEQREGQDGRIPEFEHKNSKFEFRISTWATIYGEKIVLRILEKESEIKSLEELGFSKTFIETIDRHVNYPFGLILNSGATGSGKSTTLYALLKKIDRETLNVNSIEDPVEKTVPNVNQVCVHKTGIGFQKHLRNLLRQDPNVIVVGEVRDKETSNLAIEAALTGHLVISTVHTNSAIETLNRFYGLDVEKFQLSAALIGIASQRLVRVLCPKCKQKRKLNDLEKDWIYRLLENIQMPRVIEQEYIYEHQEGNCPECFGIGYKERTVVAEYLTISPQLKALIAEGSTREKIFEEAIRNGFVPMQRHALEKMYDGVTSFDEVVKLFQM